METFIALAIAFTATAYLILSLTEERKKALKRMERGKPDYQYHPTTVPAAVPKEHSEEQIDREIRDHIKTIQKSLKRSEAESAIEYGNKIFLKTLGGKEPYSWGFSDNAIEYGCLIGKILCLSSSSLHEAITTFLNKENVNLELWRKKLSEEEANVDYDFLITYIKVFAAEFLAETAVEFDLERQIYFLKEIENKLQEYLIDFTEAHCKNGEAKDTQATRENEQEDLESSGDAEDIVTPPKRPPNKLFGISKGDLVSNYMAKPFLVKQETILDFFTIEDIPSPHSKLVKYFCNAFSNGEINRVMAHSRIFNLTNEGGADKRELNETICLLLSQLKAKYGIADAVEPIDFEQDNQIDVGSDPISIVWNFGDRSSIMLGCERLERFTEPADSIIESEIEGIDELRIKINTDKILTTKDHDLADKYVQRRDELEKLRGSVYIFLRHEFDYPLADYIEDIRQKHMLEETFRGNSDDLDAL